VPRTNAAALRALFPQDNSERNVDHYINDASLLVTEVLGTSGLTPERLEVIERYLAAHLYVLGEQEGGVFEEKIGESTEKRGSTFTLGRGLALTRFGQLVLSWDSTGSFADMETASAKKKAQFRLA